MDIKTLKLLKIQYNTSIEELDNLLFKKMSEEEKKWTHQISTQVPNESILDEFDVVHDILLADENIRFKIENMLNRLNLIYKTFDISEIYINNPKLLSEKLVEDIDKFVKNSIILDDVLDRINEVGFENINIFEKKFLTMLDGNNFENS